MKSCIEVDFGCDPSEDAGLSWQAAGSGIPRQHVEIAGALRASALISTCAPRFCSPLRPASPPVTCEVCQDNDRRFERI